VLTEEPTYIVTL